MLRTLLLLVGIGATACGDGLDPGKLLPRKQAGCVSGPTGGCSTAPVAPTQLCGSARGDWSLLVPLEARYRELSIADAPAGVAVAAIDWDAQDGKDNLAGLAVATPGPASADPLEVGLARARAIAGAGVFRSLALVSSGQLAGGALAATVLEARLGSTASLYAVRNPLFPLLTALDVDLFRDLPAAPTESSDAFVLSYATSPRAQGAVLLGSVATRGSFQSRLGKAGIRALDLADGGALAPRDRTPSAGCFTAELATGHAARADLLLVLDAADSLSDRRIALHQAAASFWSRARAAGLDLRIAVVDHAQHDPGSAVGLCRPKGCAGPFYREGDSGLACFQECLLSPGSGSAVSAPAGSRRGVESARRAVLSLLPHAEEESPQRLRAGALLALLVVGDEEDAGLAAGFPAGVPDPPAGTALEAVDGYLAPLRDLLRGHASPGNELPAGTAPGALAGSVLHALVPYPLGERAPGTPCALRRGVAYRRLATSSGGFFADLCLEDHDLFLELLVQDLAARAGARGPLGLGRAAAGAGLAGVLDGAVLFRSLSRGFTYRRAGNGIVLFDLASRLEGSGPHRLELGHVSF